MFEELVISTMGGRAELHHSQITRQSKLHTAEEVCRQLLEGSQHLKRAIILLPFQLTFSQCLSLMPGLQMVWMMGRFTLNASSFFLMLSAERRGPGRSPKVLVSLCMVRHMAPTSSSTCSASNFRKGPVQREGRGGERQQTEQLSCTAKGLNRELCQSPVTMDTVTAH